jgi:hypothetical protein
LHCAESELITAATSPHICLKDCRIHQTTERGGGGEESKRSTEGEQKSRKGWKCGTMGRGGDYQDLALMGLVVNEADSVGAEIDIHRPLSKFVECVLQPVWRHRPTGIDEGLMGDLVGIQQNIEEALHTLPILPGLHVFQ